MASWKNKTRKERVRNFLLTFFDEDKYSTKEVNGFVLEKNWDGASNRWQVMIYTKETHQKKLTYIQFNKIPGEGGAKPRDKAPTNH